MRYWNRKCLGLVFYGAALVAAANIFLMYSPGRFYKKLAVFIGGILLSLTGLIMQVRSSWRHQGVRQTDQVKD